MPKSDIILLFKIRRKMLRGIVKLVRGVQPTRSVRQPPPPPLKVWKVKGEGPFFCLEKRSSDWLIISQRRGTGNRNKRKLTLESWETETTDLSSSKEGNRLPSILGETRFKVSLVQRPRHPHPVPSGHPLLGWVLTWPFGILLCLLAQLAKAVVPTGVHSVVAEQ